MDIFIFSFPGATVLGLVVDEIISNLSGLGWDLLLF
jgi:hypothetical protein